MNTDDVDKFGELSIQLSDCRIRAADDKGNARYTRIVSGGYIERFDVVPARREHSRHSGQSTDLILQEN